MPQHLHIYLFLVLCTGVDSQCNLVGKCTSLSSSCYDYTNDWDIFQSFVLEWSFCCGQTYFAYSVTGSTGIGACLPCEACPAGQKRVQCLPYANPKTVVPTLSRPGYCVSSSLVVTPPNAASCITGRYSLLDSTRYDYGGLLAIFQEWATYVGVCCPNQYLAYTVSQGFVKAGCLPCQTCPVGHQLVGCLPYVPDPYGTPSNSPSGTCVAPINSETTSVAWTTSLPATTSTTATSSTTYLPTSSTTQLLITTSSTPAPVNTPVPATTRSCYSVYTTYALDSDSTNLCCPGMVFSVGTSETYPRYSMGTCSCYASGSKFPYRYANNCCAGLLYSQTTEIVDGVSYGFGVCTTCVSGTWVDQSTNNNRCIACPTGTYSDPSITPITYTCQPCMNAQLGYYYVSSGQCASCCAVLPCQNVPLFGQFYVTPGLCQVGQCTNLLPGYNYTGFGTDSTNCPMEPCIAGTYCINGCPSGTYSIGKLFSSTCLPCRPGSYSDTVGQLSCQTCNSGYYCPASATQPTTCSVGSYCPQGSPTPVPCPPFNLCPSSGMASPVCIPGVSLVLSQAPICSSCTNCAAGRLA